MKPLRKEGMKIHFDIEGSTIGFAAIGIAACAAFVALRKLIEVSDELDDVEESKEEKPA